MTQTQRISKYEILEKIAEGGFGVVYKARDPFIKRLVAIKTCSVNNQEMARRFFREAEIAGRFDHPNVTIVHDFGVEGELAYLVQEYLSGEDLLAKIRRGDDLPLVEKLDYLTQTAAGLAYAHGKQVIHRDIKPANIRVLENGQVKIMDFGIAKLTSSSTQLTQEGTAVGTLGYLSPEQLRDGELDERTDVFSFGVVAYELISYRSPFRGKDLSSLMKEILHKTPPPVDELMPECPPRLAACVARCLEKDPARRWANFEELLAELAVISRQVADGQPDAMISVSSPAAPPAEDEAAAIAARDTKPVPLAVEPANPEGPTTRMQLPPPPAAAAAAGAAAAEAAGADAADPDAAAEPDAAGGGAAETGAPAGASTPAPARLPVKLLVIAAAAALLVGVVAIALWWTGGEEAVEAPRATTPAAGDGLAEGPAVAPVAPQSRLVVLAAPWGEVQAVTRNDGTALPVPDRAYTPLSLELPPGAYTVTVAHPDAEQPASCDVDLAESATETCRLELLAIDATDYFREAGWWR
ncbi:MAG TPA: serine/threonine-protein kinase [Thermoanaerobaculia bacterium]|nr:serine/threonine-protein kinase [Thermoanaerobaculia bacterium]